MHDTARPVPDAGSPEAQHEKHVVALSSVLAAIVLTGTKLAIGLLTGSLGILAEAAHSGLDLAAAVMTLFAVRFSGRAADLRHGSSGRPSTASSPRRRPPSTPTPGPSAS
jgi:Co/Zn/Cd efflux system component